MMTCTLIYLAIAIVMIPVINADCDKPVVYYLGCFKDSADRDMNGLGLPNAFFQDNMDIEMCLDYCVTRGFKYAGVQYAGHCFCDDKFGKHGSVSNSECNMACKGNSRQNCGGHSRNGVYLVR